jgi:hypothetical protein
MPREARAVPHLAAELVALKVDVIVTAAGTQPPWPPSKRPALFPLSSLLLAIR